MTEWVVSILAVTGASLMLLAALGIARLPDFAARMHASTKAGALGAILLLIAVAVHFAESVVTARAIAITVFILMTAPVAAHVIGRAAYFAGVPLWSGTVKDELKTHYNVETHELLSGLDDEPDEGNK